MRHIAIIELWPSLDVLSEDLDERKDTVRKWRERGRIPSKKWSAVAKAAKKRKIEAVTLEALAGAA